MELTASNIATCTIATTRCAAGGVMRGVTKATAFSFQSAITSANAEAAGVISATATSTVRRLACMLCSLLIECSGLRVAAARLRARNCDRLEHVPRARCSAAIPIKAACGVMRDTHTTRGRHPVPDLYRAPERARTNCLSAGLRVAIGEGYGSRRRDPTVRNARLIRTVTGEGHKMMSRNWRDRVRLGKWWRIQSAGFLM